MVHCIIPLSFMETTTQVDLVHLFSVSVSPSTLDKLGCRLAMPVGSSTVWSMEYSQTGRCLLTKPSAEETMPSIPFSVRRVLGSMSLELFLSIWSQQSLVSVPFVRQYYSEMCIQLCCITRFCIHAYFFVFPFR